MSSPVVFTEPMKLDSSSMINMKLSEEPSASGRRALKKASGGAANFNATASSIECIEDAHSRVNGMRVRVPAIGVRWWEIHIGFTRAEPSSSALRESCDPGLLSFAAFFGMNPYGKSWLSAMESGECVQRHLVPWYGVKAGDVIDLKLSDEDSPKMQLWLNDALKYTWNTPVQFPLFAKFLPYHEGPVVEDPRWINNNHAIANMAQQLEATEATWREEMKAARAVAEERLEAQLQEAQDAAGRKCAVMQARLEEEKTAALRVVLEEKSQVEAELQREKGARRAATDDLNGQLQEAKVALRAIIDVARRMQPEQENAAPLTAELEAQLGAVMAANRQLQQWHEEMRMAVLQSVRIAGPTSQTSEPDSDRWERIGTDLAVSVDGDSVGDELLSWHIADSES